MHCNCGYPFGHVVFVRWLSCQNNNDQNIITIDHQNLLNDSITNALKYSWLYL